MALELKYSVEENEDRFGITFSEKTGLYSSTANIGGWAATSSLAGNPVVLDAIDAVVTITKRGDGVSYPVNVYPTFPTSSREVDYLISSTSFGVASGTKIPDGIYKVTYSVDYLVASGAQASAFDSFYFAFTGALKCCISNIRAGLSVPSGDCECQDEAITDLSNAETLLNSICDLVQCDKLDKAQEVIEYLQRYCECNCSTCN